METEDFTRDHYLANLEPLEAPPPETRFEITPELRAKCKYYMSRILAATDGAARLQADHRFRRAGLGVTFGTDHPWNRSAPLRTFTQTSDRAELAALVWVAERVPEPIWVLCDNQWVVDTAEAMRMGTQITKK